jgi:hypothetical protein
VPRSGGADTSSLASPPAANARGSLSPTPASTSCGASCGTATVADVAPRRRSAIASCPACTASANARKLSANHHRHTKYVATFTASAIGALHRRNSVNENPALSAIITPIGLPMLLAADPMLVANTSMMMNGAGRSRYLLVRWSIVPVMNRMLVTSSTSAADTVAMIISTSSSDFGRGPTRVTMWLTTCSKNWFSSR